VILALCSPPQFACVAWSQQKVVVSGDALCTGVDQPFNSRSGF